MRTIVAVLLFLPRAPLYSQESINRARIIMADAVVLGVLNFAEHSPPISGAHSNSELGNVPCSQIRCRGERVEHFLGRFAFCVPAA